jgi:tRNA pseudouridine38-40 synthase
MLLGRTDSGVHALCQVANFKTESQIDVKKIPYALNSKLQNSIVIKSAKEMEERFHSRYNCVGKTYKYVINNNEFPSALNRYREFHEPLPLDFEAMKEALSYFEGTHDFAGFKSSGGSPKKTTIRTISKAEIKRSKDNIYTITLTGDGFLYNMVRIISGTIVDVGLRKD